MFMRSKIFILLFLVFVGGFIHALDIEEINGTWVDDERLLKSSRIYEWGYSWGRGWQITDGSLAFDLGQEAVMIPGMGKYLIDTVFKNDEGSICLRVFYISDEARKYPIEIKVTFIDTKRVYIYCSEWEKWHDKSYSPDEKWVWYRLSGPKGNL